MPYAVLSVLLTVVMDDTTITWAPVITALQSQITVGNVVTVLAALVTAGIGFVWMWWGVRKATGSLMAAFKRGKVRL